MSKTKIQIVAEIGCNHMGQLNLAKLMIDQAKQAGADHSASLELEGLSKLRVRLDETILALNYKPKKILECEKFQRSYLKSVKK